MYFLYTIALRPPRRAAYMAARDNKKITVAGIDIFSQHNRVTTGFADISQCRSHGCMG